jgi:short-chain fatty acids transporter
MNVTERTDQHKPVTEGRIAGWGLAMADWSEKWFPDPLVFAFLGVVIVYLIGVMAGEKPGALALQAGKNFWTLVPFTMQMAMVIVGGYIVATSPLIRRAIVKLARIPKTPRGAITMVALFATLTSLISWGFSPIFSSFLTRELAKRIKGLDYRACGAASYLGTGSVWAMGLSSSAAMLMATKSSMPASLYEISGLIPLAQTLLLWQSIATVVLVICSSVLVAFLSAPSPENARTMESYGISFDAKEEKEARTRPGEWLEFSPLLTILVVAMLVWYLADVFRTSEKGALAALDLNTYNLIFVTLALLLHWRPKSFLKAVADAIPATGGVLIQFPFYAMIFGMITGTGLSEKIAHLFVSISSHETYGLLAAVYSSVLGLFIPSGGSKWIVEAPYVLQAAIAHKVHMGWVVQIYNIAEALPNLVNPFWMLPLLGILKLRARDLVGYTALQLVVNAPLVFFLCWIFARSMEFVPPMK